MECGGGDCRITVISFSEPSGELPALCSWSSEIASSAAGILWRFSALRVFSKGKHSHGERLNIVTFSYCAPWGSGEAIRMKAQPTPLAASLQSKLALSQILSAALRSAWEAMMKTSRTSPNSWKHSSSWVLVSTSEATQLTQPGTVFSFRAAC